MISESEENLETIVTTSIAQEIEDNLSYTETNVKSVVDNPTVQELFAKRDREGLYKYFASKLWECKGKFSASPFPPSGFCIVLKNEQT